jgi:hypothetical protein
MNSAKSDLYTQITHIVDTSQWRDVEALTFLDNNLYSSSKGRGKVYKKPDATTTNLPQRQLSPRRPLVVGGTNAPFGRIDAAMPLCGIGGTKSRHVQKCKLFFKYGILFSFIMTLILIAVLTLNNSIINYHQHGLDKSPTPGLRPYVAAKPRSSDTTPLTLDDDNTTPLTLDDDDNTTPLTLDDDDRILDGGGNTTPLTLDDDDRILDDDNNTTPRVLDVSIAHPLQQVFDLLDRGIGDTANLIDNVVANSLEKKDVILVNKTVIIDATRNYIIVKTF